MINIKWLGVMVLALVATTGAYAQNMVGQPTNLTPGFKYTELWGKIAWDGSKVSFTSLKGKVDGTGLDKDCYVATPDGTILTKASPRPKNAEECGWLSPDGSKVVLHAFTAAAGGESGATEIYVVDLATGVSTQMTYNTAYDAYPAWSPDGSKILFLSQRGVTGTQSYQVFVMDADRPEDTPANPTGNIPVQLTNPQGVDTSTKAQCVRAIWSPDSTKILFLGSGWVDAPRTELYIMDAIDTDYDKWGQNLVRLTDNINIRGTQVTLADPVQYFDGGRVFFTMGDRAGKFNIYSLDPTGTNKDIWQQTAGPFQADFICPSGNLKMMARISVDDNTNAGIGVANTDVAIYSLVNDNTPGNLNGTLVSQVGQPAPGYYVKLYNGYNTTPVAQTLTDENGHYEFTGLRPGGYYVEFTSDDTYPIQISTVNRGVIVPPGGTTVQNAFTSPRAAPRVRGVIPTIKGANVSIRWVVNLESSLPTGWTYVGFNIYRGATENGPWTKLNTEPISKIGPYEYVDTTATDLLHSFYTMTTVTTDGATTLESMYADVGQAANNLLYNANYEIDNTTTGRPDGWVPAMFGTGNNSTLETGTEDKIEGAKSMLHRLGDITTANWDIYAHTDLPYCVPTDSDSMYINGTYSRFIDTPDATTKASTNFAYSITEPNAAIPAWYDAGFKSNIPVSASGGTNWDWLYNTNSQAPYEFATYIRVSTYMLGTTTSTPKVTRTLFDDTRYQVKRVGPTGAVWGRVMDAAGNGVAGVTITDGTRTTESGPNGAWALRKVPTGPATITISYPGQAPIVETVSNIGGYRFPTDHKYSTVIPMSAGGRILLPSGQPAEGATVRLLIGNISTLGWEDNYEAVTNANGEYTFDFSDPVPNDLTQSCYVIVTKAGYQAVSQSGKYLAKAGRTNFNMTLGRPVPIIEIARATTAPTIDGVVNAAEWSRSAEISLDWKVGATVPPDVTTKAYALWDDNNVYFAFVCNEPNLAGITALASGLDSQSPSLWADDNVELFLDPMASVGLGYGREVWQIGVNNNMTAIGWNDGTIRVGPVAQSLRQVESIWSLAPMTSQDAGKSTWSVEFSIPYGDLSQNAMYIEPPALGDEWRGLFCRVRNQDGQASASSYIAGPYYTSDFGLHNTLKFVQNATPKPTLGDLNGDGSITAADTVIAINIAAGREALGTRLSVGDINGDGKVDMVDAARIQRKVNNLDAF